MRLKLARGIAAAGLCGLLAVGPAAPVSAQPTDTTPYSVYSPPKKPPPSDAPSSDGPSTKPPPYKPPSETSHGGDHHSHNDLLPWLIGGAVLLGGAAAASSSNNHKDAPSQRPPPTSGVPTRAQLLAYGPDVVEVQPQGVFAAYGLVRSGAPIDGLGYDSDPGSATWLSVTVGGETWTQGLPSGRHSVLVPFAGGGAARSTPALITVQSQTRVMSGPSQPSRIDVVGLGVGGGALGPHVDARLGRNDAGRSARLEFARFDGLRPELIRVDSRVQDGAVAINGLIFALSGRQVGGDYARFAYQMFAPFSRLDMEILRYDTTTVDGRPLLIRVASVAQWGLKDAAARALRAAGLGQADRAGDLASRVARACIGCRCAAGRPRPTKAG